jgi:hypothetical protein
MCVRVQEKSCPFLALSGNQNTHPPFPSPFNSNSDAKRHYLRARDYCSTSSHIVKVYLNFVKVCLHDNEWDGVLAHVTKAKTMDDFLKSVRHGTIWAGFESILCRV